MAKPKFDPSKFSQRLGVLYYDGKRATAYRIKQYNRFINGGSSKRNVAISKQYSKYFSSNTRFTGRNGHVLSWAKNLTLKGGANPNFNYNRVQYRDFDGKLHRVSSKERWGTNINQKSGSNAATVLIGTKQWLRQIYVSHHALYVNAENFRVVVGRRALKVFQNSFKEQRFYSNNATNWRPLASYTLKKRARRGTGSRILKEYGDLLSSIKIKDNADLMTTRVYTDVVPANESHHKKHSICYAGYHNEGKGTYGKGWKGHKPAHYIRRQFIGHSSHLDPLTDNFMRKIVKMYLFDAVFLAKKQ